MKTFTIELRSATQCERIDGTVSFVAEDGSGSFGILAGHERMTTVLGFGLARFRLPDEDWQYIALPGALLYFAENRLCLCTRRYLRDVDLLRVSAALREQLLREEEGLLGMKQSLHRLEQEMFKRLLQTRASEGAFT
jgi:F-type H+-transporting ATPase subunit epsilon